MKTRRTPMFGVPRLDLFSSFLWGAFVLQSACAGSSSQPSDDSRAKIVNGTVDTGHPEVLRLLMGRDPVRGCTGVAISDTVILMNSHCVDAKTYTEGVTIEGSGANSKTIVSQKALEGATRITGNAVKYDVAAAIFPAGTFQSTAKIAKASAAKGALVTLVGYGAASFENMAENAPLGEKRSGTNTLVDAKNGAYYLYSNLKDKAAPHNAVAAIGDSGGPAYNEQGELIGLISALYFMEGNSVIPLTKDAAGKTTLPLDRATFAGNALVDLLGPEAQKVIQAAQTGVAKSLKDDIKLAGDEYLAVCFGTELFSGLLGKGGNNPAQFGQMFNLFKGLFNFGQSKGGQPG